MAGNTRLTAAERREQLLDATKGIAVDRGFHAVSIEAVCRAAGISRPIVYGHFGDLPGLLDALVKRETTRALDQLAAILPGVLGEGDPRERLLAALEAYLRTVTEDPSTWRLALMPPEGAPATLRESVARGREAVIGLLTEAVAPGFTPDAAPPDPAMVARWLSAIADESARLILTRPQEFTVERAVAAARWTLGALTQQR
jgi:AcrR family transcriptional regulator